jgi:hypothetical protein
MCPCLQQLAQLAPFGKDFFLRFFSEQRIIGTLALLGVYAFAPPGVLGGLVDAVAVKVIDKSKEKYWEPEDIEQRVGRTLGRGNFGTVAEAFVSDAGRRKFGLKKEEEKVVVKRCVDEAQSEIEAYFYR